MSVITGGYDMNINFELYRVFYEVANAGNITKAAEKLMISQPAVTKQIKTLEGQLGGELFIRTKRGVILTDNGQEIYNFIKQGMNCFEMAEKQFSNLKKLETGVVRIGVSTTLAKLYLLKYLDMYHKHYPNVAIQIFTDPSSILREKLKDGSLDILIAKEEEDEDPDLKVDRLGELHHCFIAGNNYSHLKNQTISWKELNNYPILLPKTPSTSRGILEKYCHKYNVEISSKLEIASAGLLEEFAKIGLGISFVTEEFAQKEIDIGDVFKVKTVYDIPPVGFALITLKNSFHSFGANAFIEMLLKK